MTKLIKTNENKLLSLKSNRKNLSTVGFKDIRQDLLDKSPTGRNNFLINRYLIFKVVNVNKIVHCFAVLV